MDDLLDLSWPAAATPQRVAGQTAQTSKPSNLQANPGSSLSSTKSYRATNPAQMSQYGHRSNQQLTVRSSVPATRATISRPSSVDDVHLPARTSRGQDPHVGGASGEVDAFSSLFDPPQAVLTSHSSVRPTQIAARPLTPSLRPSTPVLITPYVAAASNQAMPDDLWNFDALVAPAQRTKVTRSEVQYGKQRDLLDDSLENAFVPPSSVATQSSLDLQAAFDQDADDEILGALAAPVGALSAPSPGTSEAHEPPKASTDIPPHILGELVMMGFAPDLSSAALLKTRAASGQWDLQAAVESLMDMVLGADQSPQGARGRPLTGSLSRADDEESPSDDGMDPPSRRQRFKYEDSEADQTQSAKLASSHPSRVARGVAVPGAVQPWEGKANELLDQASMVGYNVLTTANKFWKSSKQQLQKAIDERTAASIASKGEGRALNGRPTDARPRWLTRELDAAGSNTDIPPVAFSDSVVGLISATEKRPTSSDSTDGTTTIGSAPAHAQSKPVQPLKPKHRRGETTASPLDLQTSDRHRIIGNKLFKLGDYAGAIDSYAVAIDALPRKHLLQIPLHNNMANANMRIGNDRQALQDATSALALLLDVEELKPNYKLDHAILRQDTLPEECASINLCDQLGKALSRRAKALEACEHWPMAQYDWLQLKSAGEVAIRSAGGLRTVYDGLARCRTAGERRSAQPIALRSRLAMQPTSSTTPETLGSAVRALRIANAAQEAEAGQRLELKDSVDQRLTVWRAGKESNLRALLTSLQLILWAELEWKAIGMHEVLTETQLKIRYMKAIAKVHPDKLSASCTLEQRMLADGVFATLNEAWHAAKRT
ncbi:uncharacterized protein L969DRAFT_83630 [Mixia osmundae IAM 14324]|uniref:UBA domain-containing protein n=1 Tax=Mixia osmundae (strain CBS 9802 / IAM 14324 / JCM 22182 / KY 12970) TaxID=764103 RepID=G7DSQ4_MIXOS|nr:uncharacterized protein L969DRAFT_83630 [Mixia osmundae IAM 14324]KEI41795.1 hypothetical protein L969DRAFT_83630 [Mixia osmundae IAM 14324]GAA93612.1 hypothetical protein E5Q_00256 [Mixia osmundae IAM 14324]